MSVVQGCLGTIRHQTSLMKEALYDGHLLNALKHCATFLNELRTASLTPKDYYEVYMAVFDLLEQLSAHLLLSHEKKGKSSFLEDLYKTVQYSANVLPRLYMMIVVGTAFMSTDKASAKFVMQDMMEMCRGVQHPIRGLFLRHYLSQRTKDLLPISTKEDFDETVSFLVTNFIEMNKLWVRLQHQGHSSEREARSKERRELKILVGSNLVRLSQVVDDFAGGGADYLSVDFYDANIFSTITDQIIQCRDQLAQEYLTDVVIQIFPDTFHFRTLEKLLDVFVDLHPMLRKSQLVETLVERFILYHKNLALASDTEKLSLNGKRTSEPQSPVLFECFWKFYEKLKTELPETPTEEFCSILNSLIKLSLTYEPENHDNLNKIYELAAGLLQKDEVSATWVNLVAAPVRHFPSVTGLLALPFFHELFAKLSDKPSKRQLALEIANKLMNSNEKLATQQDIDNVFQYVETLVSERSEPSTASSLGVTKAFKVDGGEKHVTEEFLATQETLCKLLHLVEQPDNLKCVSSLLYVRKKYLSKSTNNIIYTYPSVITRATHKLRLAGRELLKAGKSEPLIATNLKNLTLAIDELHEHHQKYHSETVLRLYLTLAGVADQLRQETLAYELFTRCFVVYELGMPSEGTANPHLSMGGSLSYEAVISIANQLSRLRYFSRTNYEGLITKLTLHGSKLLKKQDLCRSVYFCAHLWWWCDLLVESSPTTQAPKAQMTEEPEEKSEEPKKTKHEETEPEETKEAEPEETTKAEANEPTETPYRDAKRVLECLQKALRIADSCMDSYLLVRLFIEILNRCLVFHVYGNWLIDRDYINGLIGLIRTNIENLSNHEDDDEREALLLRHIDDYLERSVAFYQLQVSGNPVIGY